MGNSSDPANGDSLSQKFASLWAYVDPLTVEQAARLWNNFDPSMHEAGPGTSQDIRSGVKAIIQLLSGGFSSGEFPADPKNYLEAIGNFQTSNISRDSLRKFAAKRNMRPSFLFDTVIGSNSEISAVSETTPTMKNPGGRPTEWDWDAMLGEIIRIADFDGLPVKPDTEVNQAALVASLLGWFRHHFGEEPGDSTVKKRVSAILSNYRRAKQMQDQNPSE